MVSQQLKFNRSIFIYPPKYTPYLLILFMVMPFYEFRPSPHFWVTVQSFIKKFPLVSFLPQDEVHLEKGYFLNTLLIIGIC